VTAATDADDPLRTGFERSKPAKTHGAPQNRAFQNPPQQLSASVTAGRLPSVNPGRLTAAIRLSASKSLLRLRQIFVRTIAERRY
jgi:hypothetical protein